MATPDEQWWEAQAGEYALGSLRGTERDVYERILANEEDARAKVAWWQNKLSALDSRMLPVEPPPHLLPLIMRRIRQSSAPPERNVKAGYAEHSDQTMDVLPKPARHSDPNNVVPHRRHRARRSNLIWKSITGLATAASVAMAALLLQSQPQNVLPPSGPQLNMVSIVQNESQEPVWVLSTTNNSDQLQVVALTPPTLEDNQAFELWMVKPDDAGVSSVGLLPTSEGESLLLTLPINTADAQLFAVSVEPAGGSPEAVPTGPVLFSGAIRSISGNRL